MAKRSGREAFTVSGVVGGAMALLGMRGKYNDYKQASAEDEEGRVALTSAFMQSEGGEGGNIALLDTETPSKRSSKCSLIWKAIGVVFGIFISYYIFRAIKWAFTDAPSGLEGMPEFGSSLGCVDAPYVYNQTTVTKMIPIGTVNHDHNLDVRGAGVGTILILDGDESATEMKYEVVVRTNKEDMLKDVHFILPDISQGTVTRSRLMIDTSQVPAIDDRYCMRFDVKLYIPPNLRNLGVSSHVDTQVAFGSGTRAANVDNLFVSLFTISTNNVIRPSASVVAKKMNLELNRGWIVGEASVVDQLQISTQRGDGTSNVKITPAAPSNPAEPGKAVIYTITGAGRSDFVIDSGEYKRKIEATHTSSRNADMYFTYAKAKFNGKIELSSNSYTVTGATAFNPPQKEHDWDDENAAKWTHFAGKQDGGDVIRINSRGWSRLAF